VVIYFIVLNLIVDAAANKGCYQSEYNAHYKTENSPTFKDF
jgi:hypothetical protein